ncbi:MAG: hypothetical protein R3268_03555, partial [Acidiferrobacterales bacterium]|nr:hypothetical protein [Acidiferrobacterales bacterium]
MLPVQFPQRHQARRHRAIVHILAIKRADEAYAGPAIALAAAFSGPHQPLAPSQEIEHERPGRHVGLDGAVVQDELSRFFHEPVKRKVVRRLRETAG